MALTPGLPESFSSEIALLSFFAKNGSGKTPIVQSIVFALGYKVEFRDDILEHCSNIILEVECSGKLYQIQRALTSRFSVGVTSDDFVAEFASEREYSRFLMGLWKVDDALVTTVGNEAARMYSLHILPLFYLDQSHGYANEYYSTSRFIKDQYAEVMRLVFGLAARNPFDKRRELIELKEKLDDLDRSIVRSERQIESLTSDLVGPRRPEIELDAELQVAVSRLEDLRESDGLSSSVDAEIDERLSRLRQRERALAHERSEVEARVRGFVQIRNEIEVEANTLSLNEEARRVFASFDAICTNEGCGLFVRSSDTYGKSLLYLRDQMKDLERINSAHHRRLEQIRTEQSALSLQISAIRSERLEAMNRSPVAALVEATAQLTENVIRLKRAKHIEAELANLESAYVARLNERAWIQDRLSSLDSATRHSDLGLLKIRLALGERIKHWLDVLNASNVSRDVQVDIDFGVTFGGQKISKFTGSTLTRIVLAIRTGTFELAAAKSQSVPRFFILDTPRQQDIERADLAEFIRQLQQLATTRSTQLVFSTTNHRYDLGDEDAEWLASFPGEEHTMYLGSVSKELHDTSVPPEKP